MPCGATIFFTPPHKAGDQVELAFANHGKSGVDQRPFGFVEPIEHLALGEDGCLRRIHVLGRLLVSGQDPSAEGDDSSLFIADREHQASPEPVIIMGVAASVFVDNQPGLFDQGQFVMFGLGPENRVVPRVGGIADAKQCDGFSRDAAFGQVGAGDLTGGFAKSLLPMEGDLLVQTDEGVFGGTILRLGGVIVDFERDLGAVRETPDGFGKAEIFVFLEKAKDVTTLMAAKAVKDLALGIDVEAG